MKRTTETAYVLYKYHELSRVGALLMIVVFPHAASATGFFISGQTPTAVGRALAGNNVIASDATTVFWNPAGMTYLAGRELVGTGSIIVPEVSLSDTGTTAASPGTLGARLPSTGNDGGNAGSVAFVPGFSFAQPLGDRWWIGLTANSPYGLSTRYSRGWFGRYDSQEASLFTIDVAPSVAYEWSENVALGAGLDIQYARAELTNALPNPFTPGGPTAATDGRFLLRGDDTSIGFNTGAIIKINDDTRVALHYRSAMEHELEGTATTIGLTEQLAELNGNVKGSTDLGLPEVASIGAAHAIGNLTLLAQSNWSGWSRLEEIRIRFDNGLPDQVRTLKFQDAYSVAVGGEYKPNGTGGPWTLRGGLAYESTISRDAFRNASVPDAEHYWLSVGLSYDRGFLHLDVGYAHLFYADTSLNLSRRFYEGTPLLTTIDTKARAEGQTDILSAAMRMRF